MPRKIKAKIGDVFAIPISDECYGYGQIVAGGKPKYYAVYNIKSEKQHPEINEIINSPIIFLAKTIDSQIEDGIWILLGNAPVVQEIEYPEYIIETLEGIMVMDYEGNLIRPATEEEQEKLPMRKSYSPVAFEKATKAWFGTGEPYPYIDELLYRAGK